MKTTLDIQNILYGVISGSSNITGSITGGVYKGQRPVGSTKEDIVVGSLPINNEQLQQTVANINIHVPNQAININGVQDSVPNSKRLNELTRLVWGLVDESYHGTYWFWVQQQNTFQEGEEYYSNIRLNFISENI